MSDPGQPDAAAVFTDQDGAEQFRDENAAQHQVFPISSAEEFRVVLAMLRARFSLVAFDPYRAGKKVSAVPIDDLIHALGG